MNQYITNPQMQQAIDSSPVFSAIEKQLQQARDKQAMQYDYIYHVSGTVTGQATSPFFITIEQGTDFMVTDITGSCFSYDADDASTYPMPNNQGLTAWAGRGLTFKITDSRAGRELTSGYVGAENILTPGYGLNFQRTYPFRYLLYRNTKLRFDVRNLDNANRSHVFDIALKGFKVVSAN